MRDLNDKLANVPTKWEVRFLIVAALAVQDFIPTADAAQAALRFF